MYSAAVRPTERLFTSSGWTQTHVNGLLAIYESTACRKTSTPHNTTRLRKMM